jgi:isocitrate/isopropylmalate dehydrogenase
MKSYTIGVIPGDGIGLVLNWKISRLNKSITPTAVNIT